MFGSFRLGTILGIPVGVNWSVLLIAWLIAFNLAGQLLPTQVPGLDAALYWAVGALAAVLFFGSLLAHELSHAIVARREGLTVSGITLWLLGGVARMDGDPRSPGAEARIAGVGPLTSFALAAVFAGAAAGLSFARPSDFVALATASAAWLALVNLVLGVFNLLPGAPLDGGRIMRATLWRMRQDKLQATRWATGLGQLLGYGLLGIGILRVLSGDIAGIWLVLLGFFLSGAASAERRSTELTESLRGTRVGDIMTRQLLRVPSGLTVETFAAAAAEGRTSAWLVVGPGGHVTGVLGIDELRTVRSDEQASKRIGELAVPMDSWPAAFEDELVRDVLVRLDGGATRAVVRGREQDPTVVLGLLLPEDISRAVAVGQLAGDREKAGSRDRGASEDRVAS